MTAAISKENGKWRELKMEEDGNLKTLECLRGRLLAERQASKVAKENAELVEKKLADLKNKLNEEIKLKNEAEKKLKFLKRKLDSLNISSISVQSEQSSTSKSKEISETFQPKSKVTEPEISEDLNHNVADTTTSEQRHDHESHFTEENTTSHSTSDSSSDSSSISWPSPDVFCHEISSQKNEKSKIEGNMFVTPINLSSSIKFSVCT